jgi:tryptophan-rich sensory protein
MFQIFQLIQIVIGFFMWTLIGQGALALLIGEKRHTNPVYRLFQFVTRPLWRAVERFVPARWSALQVGLTILAVLVILRFAVYTVFYALGWIPSVTGGGAAG